jgi:hypothetical protein
MIVSRQQRKNRGYKQTVGSFSSCKMGTSIWYNSLLQKDFMYWLEFDPDVLSYTTPAITIDCYSNGRHKSYASDFQVVRHTKKQIIEVKPKKKVESDEYRRLHRILLDFYEETEWTLIVLTESEVQREPLLSNIKVLYRYARENFSINEYRDCLEVVRSQAPASFAEIGQALDDRHIRRNVLFKLLFHSLVEIDLKQAINAASTISAASENIDWRILFNG